MKFLTGSDNSTGNTNTPEIIDAEFEIKETISGADERGASQTSTGEIGENHRITQEREVANQNRMAAEKEAQKTKNWFKTFSFIEFPWFSTPSGSVARLNDNYFAHAYLDIHRVVYDPSCKTVFQYQPTTGCWVPISDLALEKEIRQMIHVRALIDYNDEIDCKNTHATHAAVVRTIKSLCELPGFSAQEKQNLFFHCQNGVLMFDQAQKIWNLQPFSSADYSFVSSPISYKTSAKCPKFLSVLLEPALNQEDIEMLQMYFGQCLLRRNLSQTVLLLTGNAGCGKSVIVTILEKLINEDNVAQLRESSCNSRFEGAAYLNKHLLTAKDVCSDFLSGSNAAKIKSLTGDDGMRAEQKYRNQRIKFQGKFNIVITSNGILRIKLENDRDAWSRRILWIRFNGLKPQKPITDLASKLIDEEGSGILNWAIEGAEKLARANYQFPRTEAQLQRVEELLNDCDSLKFFSEEALMEDAESDSTVKELESEYQAFCDAQGLIAMSSRELRSKLGDMMERVFHKTLRHDIKRGNTSVRGFGGIKCTWGHC